MEQYNRLKSTIESACKCIDSSDMKVAVCLMFDSSDIRESVLIDMDLILQLFMFIISASSNSYTYKQLDCIDNLEYANCAEYFGVLEWSYVWNNIEELDEEAIVSILSEKMSEDRVFVRFASFVCLAQYIVQEVMPSFSNVLYLSFVNYLMAYMGLGEKDNIGNATSSISDTVNLVWDIVYERMELIGLDPGLKVKIGKPI